MVTCGGGGVGRTGATYFVKFEVIPTECNPKHALVGGADAACWVIEESDIAAYNKALFYIAKDEWKVVKAEAPPVEVTEANFQEREIGLARFRDAQKNGIAIAYIGWSRDGKTTIGPVPLQLPRKINLNAYIGAQKRLSGSGRCLHFESGERCGKIISAHSIQKNGQLSEIANDGHVYVLSTNIGDLKKNGGQPTLVKRGVGTVSTFLGFCNGHDNQLFAPIDKIPLGPTAEQAILYAYRSVCREYFVKENALSLLKMQLEEIPRGSAMRPAIEDMASGTSLGFDALRRHKAAIEDSLIGKRHDDIEYVLFAGSQRQFIAFSGLFIPEFDFLGRQLQDLADAQDPFDLLTFCSAPTHDGWGVLFAWHKTSSKRCHDFIQSLATVTHKDVSQGAEAIFRMVLSNCENLALSPSWWEALAIEQQKSLLECLWRGVNLFVPTDPGYLTRGAEGVSNWKFDRVHTNTN